MRSVDVLAAAGRPRAGNNRSPLGNLEVDGIHSGYACRTLRKLHQFKRRRGRHPHQSAFVLSWALGTLAPQPGRFHATHVPKRGPNPRLFDELTRCSDPGLVAMRQPIFAAVRGLPPWLK